jgi:RNA recognition motif-containing protein
MTSIFVAKLDFNTTDEELKSLFERHGKVNRVTIAKDRETGKPRGFAFIEMFNDDEADAAIEALDNASVNGRNIAVKKADDRGSKPGGAPNDRPPRPENRPFRPENRTSDEKPAFRKPEDVPVRPSFTPEETIPLKSDRKKEKQKDAFAGKDKPKTHKMEAYKKSGKANRFFNDDDEDDEDWLLNRNRSNGWDDEEE